MVKHLSFVGGAFCPAYGVFIAIFNWDSFRNQIIGILVGGIIAGALFIWIGIKSMREQAVVLDYVRWELRQAQALHQSGHEETRDKLLESVLRLWERGLGFSPALLDDASPLVICRLIRLSGTNAQPQKLWWRQLSAKFEKVRSWRDSDDGLAGDN